jgi:hypothetical protein
MACQERRSLRKSEDKTVEGRDKDDEDTLLQELMTFAGMLCFSREQAERVQGMHHTKMSA